MPRADAGRARALLGVSDAPRWSRRRGRNSRHAANDESYLVRIDCGYRAHMTRWLLVVVLLAGCGDDDLSVDGGVDPSSDGGRDSGLDAALDAGSDVVADSGPADADTFDAGDGELDGGTDAGDVDAGPCSIAPPLVSAQATAYETTATTTCGAGIPAWMPYRAAVSPTRFAGGALCGSCLLVTGAASTQLVLVDDLCPSCGADDLDLQTEAAMAITGAVDGRHPVTWLRVPCEPSGNAFLDFQGSNPFYLKVRLTQIRNPLANVEIRVGSTYEAASRTEDGFFVLSPSSSVTAPVGLRITDVFGQALEFEVATITSDGMTTDTGVQFPMRCAL